MDGNDISRTYSFPLVFSSSTPDRGSPSLLISKHQSLDGNEFPTILPPLPAATAVFATTSDIALQKFPSLDPSILVRFDEMSVSRSQSMPDPVPPQPDTDADVTLPSFSALTEALKLSPPSSHQSPPVSPGTLNSLTSLPRGQLAISPMEADLSLQDPLPLTVTSPSSPSLRSPSMSPASSQNGQFLPAPKTGIPGSPHHIYSPRQKAAQHYHPYSQNAPRGASLVAPGGGQRYYPNSQQTTSNQSLPFKQQWSLSEPDSHFKMAPSFSSPPSHHFMQNPPSVSPLSPSSKGMEPPKSGRICRSEGCTKTAQTGGYCRPHGGGSRCKYPGCTKCAQKGGFCTRHGGGVRCGVKGCPKGAQVGGFCVAHGGGRRCQQPNCKKSAQKGPFCVSHGGAWRCRIPGCEKLDAGRGLCIRHGGGRRCQEKDCHKLDKGGGFCVAHGKGKPEDEPHV
mmetsp:Transcript_1659/g.2237  ORF Transcript_1659/g.2237 Transcript_1659/m.2237 type:complete len:451 (-) Transcript_1659:8-1360(-)